MIRFDQEDRKTIAAAALLKANARMVAKKARPRQVKPTAKNQRQPRERDNAFLAWVRRLSCAVAHMGGCDGPIEAAHIRFSNFAAGRINPGMQRKSHDRFCTPLCHAHHIHDQHQAAEKLFWERAGIDPDELSAALHAAFRSNHPGEPIIRAFSGKAVRRG